MTIIPVTEPGIDILVHPIAAFFPTMGEEAFEKFAADLKDIGQLEPIIYCMMPVDGQDVKVLLDGRHRYRGCRKVGLEPRMELYAGPPGREGKYILSRNVERRHLDPGQLALVVTQAFPLIAEEAEARKKATQFAAGNPGGPGRGKTVDLNSGPPSPPAKRDIAKKHASSTAGQISAITNGEVSRHNAEQAAKLLKESPALAAEVVRGHVKFREAMRLITPKPEPLPVLPQFPAVTVQPVDGLVPRRRRQAGLLVPVIVFLSLFFGLGVVIYAILS